MDNRLSNLILTDELCDRKSVDNSYSSCLQQIVSALPWMVSVWDFLIDADYEIKWLFETKKKLLLIKKHIYYAGIELFYPDNYLEITLW